MHACVHGCMYPWRRFCLDACKRTLHIHVCIVCCVCSARHAPCCNTLNAPCTARRQVLPREGGGCVVEHVLAVKPLVDVPPAVAPYTSHIFKQQVAGLLRDLADEVERLAGEPGGTAAEASRSAAN